MTNEFNGLHTVTNLRTQGKRNHNTIRNRNSFHI
nr:MAG TPA: hypothetical protein [Microviridae sp.]